MRLHELILISLLSLLIFEYADAGRNKYDAENYNTGRGLQKKKGHEYQKYDKKYSESVDDSEEDDIIKYYKKSDKDKKKTLGDVFREKKQKNQAKKQRFEKNVLKHFKTDDDEEEESSEEEIVAPLRKVKLDRCDSAEEECL